MPLPKLMPYKMTMEEQLKAKAHLELQMWYWRDNWSAESLSAMPDYIRHMYNMYGYILWLQQKNQALEKKYETATTPKVTNGSKYDKPRSDSLNVDLDVRTDSDGPVSIKKGEERNGETHSDDSQRHDEPASNGEGQTVESGNLISSGGVGEGRFDGEDDIEDVDGRRYNRDSG